MRKIISHFKENWIRYGFETAVIVSGIIIAFSLNNWNEGRKTKNIEVKILKELKSDLEANYKEIEGIRNMALGSYIRFDSLIYYLENDKPFRSGFRGLVRSGGYFNSANTAYKLIESGGLNVLSNDSLRIKVTHMYQYNFYNILIREKSLRGFYEDEVDEFRLTHFEFSDNPDNSSDQFELIPYNESELRKNNRFKSLLYSIRGFVNGRTRFMKNILDELKELIEETEVEIIRLDK